MKKYIKYIMLVLMIIPIVINASTFSESTDTSRKIFSKDEYKYTYDKYLQKVDASNNGELISLEEYKLTMKKGKTYLFDGLEYWTRTRSGSNTYSIRVQTNNEIINDNLNYSSTNSNYSTRATVYVKPDTKVNGNGTLSDPWTFESTYKVSAEVNNKNYGEVIDKDAEYVSAMCERSDCTASIRFIVNGKYRYLDNDCDASVIEAQRSGNTYKSFIIYGSERTLINSTDSRYAEYVSLFNKANEDGKASGNIWLLRANKIRRNTVCHITLGTGFYEIKVPGSIPDTIYLRHAENYYKDESGTEVITSMNSVPSSIGYEFNGYTYKGTQIIDKNKNIIQSTKSTIVEDTTLELSVIANEYEIEYTLNGGTGSGPTKATYNEEITINHPSRVGYDFTGWNISNMDTTLHVIGGTNKTATQLNSEKAKTYKNLRADTGKVNFAATWKEKALTVTYDAQGGSVSPSSKSVTFNNTYGTLATPTKTGYTFTGWYTEASGGTEVKSDTKVTQTENHIIYAHWTANKVVITYYANGGSGKDENGNTVSEKLATWTYYYDGESFKEYGLPNYQSLSSGYWRLKKDGWTATGYWILDSASGTTKINDNTKYNKVQDAMAALGKKSDLEKGNISINLYAEWNGNTYIATFEKNGATSIGSTSLNCKVTSGSTCTVTSPSITRSGYTIDGWNTNNGATSGTTVNSSITLSSDTTYYAITHKDVTITYNKNGATSIGKTSDTCTIKNTDTSCTVTSPSITRSGYTIDGWNTTSTATTGTAVGSNLTLSSDTTYYAITTKKLKATYNKNGATSIGKTSDTCTIRNTDTSCTVTSPSITRSGYTIVGWSTDQNAITGTAVGSNLTLSSDTTYYAITTKKLKATYNKNGATSIGKTSDTCTIKNTDTSCTVTSPSITRSGYTIVGWSSDQNATTGTAVGSNLTLSADTTYYAITKIDVVNLSNKTAMATATFKYKYNGSFLDVGTVNARATFDIKYDKSSNKADVTCTKLEFKINTTWNLNYRNMNVWFVGGESTAENKGLILGSSTSPMLAMNYYNGSDYYSINNGSGEWQPLMQNTTRTGKDAFTGWTQSNVSVSNDTLPVKFYFDAYQAAPNNISVQFNQTVNISLK